LFKQIVALPCFGNKNYKLIHNKHHFATKLWNTIITKINQFQRIGKYLLIPQLNQTDYFLPEIIPQFWNNFIYFLGVEQFLQIAVVLEHCNASTG